MRDWTPAFGLLLFCETFIKLQCGQCCCSLLGLQCAISMNHSVFHQQPLSELHIKHQNKLAPPPAHRTGTFPLHPWTHFFLPLCPGGCHLLPSKELLPSWQAVFSGEREVKKTQQFCLILASTLMTKPLSCVCPAEPSLPPHTALAWSTQGKGSLSSSSDASLPIFTHTDDLLYYPT